MPGWILERALTDATSPQITPAATRRPAAPGWWNVNWPRLPDPETSPRPRAAAAKRGRPPTADAASAETWRAAPYPRSGSDRRGRRCGVRRRRLSRGSAGHV